MRFEFNISTVQDPLDRLKHVHPGQWPELDQADA